MFEAEQEQQYPGISLKKLPQSEKPQRPIQPHHKSKLSNKFRHKNRSKHWLTHKPKIESNKRLQMKKLLQSDPINVIQSQQAMLPEQQFEQPKFYQSQIQSFQLQPDQFQNQVIETFQFEIEPIGDYEMSQQIKLIEIPLIIDEFCEMKVNQPQSYWMHVENNQHLTQFSDRSNRMKVQFRKNSSLIRSKTSQSNSRGSRFSQVLSKQQSPVKDMLAKSDQKGKKRSEKLPSPHLSQKSFPSAQSEVSPTQLSKKNQFQFLSQPSNYKPQTYLKYTLPSQLLKSTERKKHLSNQNNQIHSDNILKFNSHYSIQPVFVKENIKTSKSNDLKDQIFSYCLSSNDSHHRSQFTEYQVKCSCLQLSCNSSKCSCRRRNKICNNTCGCFNCKNHFLNQETLRNQELCQAISADLESSKSNESIKFEAFSFCLQEMGKI